MKTAMVLTVKNEARLLRNNLLYHKAIGADKAFVYFDNATDHGKESIHDLDFVDILDSIRPDKYKNLAFLHKFTSQADAHHTARQCLNTYDALQKCKAEGIEWLISIDADELVVPDLNGSVDLRVFFKKLPAAVELVNFEVKEIVQMRPTANNIFAEAVWFKHMSGIKAPIFKNCKNVMDPFSKRLLKFSFWYGHTFGKSAIRVSAGLVPHNVHRYKHLDKNAINAMNLGYLFHYHAYDFKDFIKKFENFKTRPNTFLSGNKVERLKLLWRDIVNSPDFSEQDLMDYYQNNVMFTPKELKKLQRRSVFLSQPPIFASDAVTKVFSKIIVDA